MKNTTRGYSLRARTTTFLFRSLARIIYYLRVVNFTAINRKATSLKGPLIIACNHISLLDPVFLWCVLRRPAVALAMAELWLKKVSRWAMNLLRHIPVDRRSPASRAKALEEAAHVLRRGGIILIFPQGRCVGKQEDEAQVRYQDGVYKLAKATGAPILAAHITGTNVMLPLSKDHVKGEKRFNRKARICLAFAPELIYADDYSTKEEALAALRHTINSLASTNS